MVFDKRDIFSCESCNQTLTVKGTNIAKKVCPNCGNAYINYIQGVKATGEKFYIPEDMSLLCLGAKGKHENNIFEVIGRKRLSFEGGYYRNDWFLLFENGSTMWLYETFCHYVLALNEFHVLKYNQVKDLSIDKSMYIADKEGYKTEIIVKFQVHQIEGELPEYPNLNNEYRLIELCDFTGSIVYIDLYSKEYIYYSKGKSVNFADFNFSHSRKADGWI